MCVPIRTEICVGVWDCSLSFILLTTNYETKCISQVVASSCLSQLCCNSGPQWICWSLSYWAGHMKHGLLYICMQHFSHSDFNKMWQSFCKTKRQFTWQQVVSWWFLSRWHIFYSGVLPKSLSFPLAKKQKCNLTQCWLKRGQKRQLSCDGKKSVSL